MGSEARALVEFHITGFKKFHGVTENPTEVIVRGLPEYLKKNGLPIGAVLGSCTVLETAGEGALVPFLDLLDSAVAEDSGILRHSVKDAALEVLHASPLPTTDKRVVWVHLGVNSGACKFAVERRAVNEATFRCPDEMGWQPQQVPIVAEDGPLSHIRETTLPVRDIVAALGKEGFDVMESYDAGRFVCNFIYYHSLHHSGAHKCRSLFVHVPLFAVIDEKSQIQFVAALLKVLAALY